MNTREKREIKFSTSFSSSMLDPALSKRPLRVKMNLKIVSLDDNSRLIWKERAESDLEPLLSRFLVKVKKRKGWTKSLDKYSAPNIKFEGQTELSACYFNSTKHSIIIFQNGLETAGIWKTLRSGKPFSLIHASNNCVNKTRNVFLAEIVVLHSHEPAYFSSDWESYPLRQQQTLLFFPPLLIKTSINHFTKKKSPKQTEENYRWFPDTVTFSLVIATRRKNLIH